MPLVPYSLSPNPQGPYSPKPLSPYLFVGVVKIQKVMITPLSLSLDCRGAKKAEGRLGLSSMRETPKVMK